MTFLIAVALASGLYWLTRLLIAKSALEAALATINISGMEFYASVPLQYILYKKPESKKLNAQAHATIKRYIINEILCMASFWLAFAINAIRLTTNA